MILSPGVMAAARLVGMPSPTVDLDDETYLLEYDIRPRYERSVDDLDLRLPTTNARSYQ